MCVGGGSSGSAAQSARTRSHTTKLIAQLLRLSCPLSAAPLQRAPCNGQHETLQSHQILHSLLTCCACCALRQQHRVERPATVILHPSNPTKSHQTPPKPLKQRLTCCACCPLCQQHCVQCPVVALTDCVAPRQQLVHQHQRLCAFWGGSGEGTGTDTQRQTRPQRQSGARMRGKSNQSNQAQSFAVSRKVGR